jgi:hypothetical protein
MCLFARFCVWEVVVVRCLRLDCCFLLNVQAWPEAVCWRTGDIEEVTGLLSKVCRGICVLETYMLNAHWTAQYDASH